MEGKKRKGGEYWPYPPPEKGWENPSSQSESIVTPGGCLRQGGFRKGQIFSLASAAGFPRCHGRIWGHGFVAAYFDGLAGAVLLRRYRCPDCKLTLRFRPLSHWPRFQSSILIILECLTQRLRLGHWPDGLSRQRQGHWLRSLTRQVRWHLGVGWAGDLIGALKTLWQRGVVPVTRSI